LEQISQKVRAILFGRSYESFYFALSPQDIDTIESVFLGEENVRKELFDLFKMPKYTCVHLVEKEKQQEEIDSSKQFSNSRTISDENKIFTPQNLLDELLEFMGMTSEESRSYEVLANDSTSLMRFQRIHAFFLVFGILEKDNTGKPLPTIKDEIHYFLSGSFLFQNHNFLSRDSLLAMIEENGEIDGYTYSAGLSDLNIYFAYLMKYKTFLYKALNLSSEFLVASKGAFAVIKLMEETNNLLEEKIKTIDKILVQFMSQTRVEIARQELVEKYDFPRTDLEKIRQQEIENY
jgi:hypothetical protein